MEQTIIFLDTFDVRGDRRNIHARVRVVISFIYLSSWILNLRTFFFFLNDRNSEVPSYLKIKKKSQCWLMKLSLIF